MKDYIIQLLSENRKLEIYFSTMNCIKCTKLVKDIDEHSIEVVSGNSSVSHIINIDQICCIEVR